MDGSLDDQTYQIFLVNHINIFWGPGSTIEIPSCSRSDMVSPLVIHMLYLWTYMWVIMDLYVGDYGFEYAHNFTWRKNMKEPLQLLISFSMPWRYSQPPWTLYILLLRHTIHPEMLSVDGK